MRRDKTNYYLDIAGTVAERGTCIRRSFGAIIVKNDEIISTGYAGAPRGRKNCNELGKCIRNELNIPRGERYELCRSVHAEANAIISARRSDMIGATLYLACIDPSTGETVGGTSCCSMCKRLVINSGIEKVIVRDTYDSFRIISVSDWIENDESLDGQSGY
ncbi:MAG: cytidine deaminase [Oscillospiraceae bacterium]|nr:cytidine deaminase [Oscillospiraceae bacterium]